MDAPQETQNERMRKNGISVIVCCYNSANRIETTLKHIFIQKVDASVDWEIIVVDNNSNDSTSDVAKKIHAQLGPDIPFSVIFEPTPGLSHARECGFANAQFNIALMVDDDNSLAQNYLNLIWERFNTDDRTGMVGGIGIPILDCSTPEWFGKYAYCYATGSQEDRPGQNEVDLLYGAGLALRLDLLDKLNTAGFPTIISDRTGSGLMSGGDTELCFAFRMAGYKLIYDHRLQFEHLLPSARIQWKYLRRLFYGFGMTKARTEIYTTAIEARSLPTDGRFPFWLNRAIFLCGQMKQDFGILTKSVFMNLEGNENVLPALARLGHIRAIIGLRGQYLKLYKDVYSFRRNLTTFE